MERVWWPRLRWRVRGAWMWPAFVAFTVADGLLLHARPIAGDNTGVPAGMLLGAFFNLLAVAVGAPLLGRLLRRSRPEVPRFVAADYAGTALIVAVCAALLAGGLIHHPAVRERQRDFRAQARAARAYVLAHAGAAYRNNLPRGNTLRVDSDLYRTCVPGPDPRRALCLYVDTSVTPPRVRRDTSREPNASFARPGAFRP
jgi:hypothetical protein